MWKYFKELYESLSEKPRLQDIKEIESKHLILEQLSTVDGENAVNTLAFVLEPIIKQPI